MALHRYGDFRVEVFYFDSPCIPGFMVNTDLVVSRHLLNTYYCCQNNIDVSVIN